ncbi:MAG TPA: hypothetical protein VGX48_01505 [Pyrinomonadaceae bacterium]|jgi:hypothetical protein|nr:hypothetical protein [Pyrinomonadaceae bacterium]
MEGFTRPEAEVLDEGSLVPGANLISPPPNQFTHVLARAQPYYYGRGRRPDGEFPEGTKVVLMTYEGGARCRVADGRGLYVETKYDGLKKL